MALGADRGTVLRRVVLRGMAMTGVGLGAGGVLAVPAVLVLRGVVYGESASRTPEIFTWVLVCLAVMAFLACVIPARGAVRLSPSTVLRAES